jgi:monoamine oxidase
VELGAEFVHGLPPAFLKTLQEAKLSMIEVADQHWLFDHGKLTEVEIWGAVDEALKRVDPDSPDFSCEKFLGALDEPVRTYVRNFVQGFDAADPQRISVQALRVAERAASEMNGSQSQWLASGYGALVDFLERDLTERGVLIHRYMTVRTIAWREGSVEVTAEENAAGVSPVALPEFLSVPPPVDPLIGGRREFAANVAVIAVPLAILQREDIRFEPALPYKLDVARKLAVGNVIKITFVFAEPFLDNFGFVHAFDEAIPTWWSDPQGCSLVGWAGGPKADALIKLFPAQLEAMGLEILGRIFPDHADKIRKHFVASHYWNWAEDPHIRGAYSYIPVGGLDLPRQLAEPVDDTLFFAGEATVSDAQTGTVFGAHDSGLRAAREVVRSGQTAAIKG